MRINVMPVETIDFAFDYNAPPVPMELPIPGVIGDEL